MPSTHETHMVHRHKHTVKHGKLHTHLITATATPLLLQNLTHIPKRITIQQFCSFFTSFFHSHVLFQWLFVLHPNRFISASLLAKLPDFLLAYINQLPLIIPDFPRSPPLKR